ncbi:hypothetical protein [Flavobacterium psychrotrophum]|nr:hypothetical protein [Flavobacterium psychrotrophum]
MNDTLGDFKVTDRHSFSEFIDLLLQTYQKILRDGRITPSLSFWKP